VCGSRLDRGFGAYFNKLLGERGLRIEAAAAEHGANFIRGRVEFGGGVEEIVRVDRIPVAAIGAGEAGDVDGRDGRVNVADESGGIGGTEVLLSTLGEGAKRGAEGRVVAKQEG